MGIRFFGRVALCAILIAMGSRANQRPPAIELRGPQWLAPKAMFVCPAVGGYGLVSDGGDIPPPKGPPKPATERIRHVQEASLTTEGVQELLQIVQMSDVVRREYMKGEYECEDFARDLQDFLEKNGYEGRTRFILIYKFNLLARKWFDKSHAMVGVLLRSGKMVFINGEGGETDALDQDNDRRVGYHVTPGTSFTEKAWRIELYLNFSEAVAAGVTMN